MTTKKLSSVSDEWKNFSTALKLETTSDTQRKEMCRAYYAGQIDALVFLTDEVVKLPDDEGVRAVAGRLLELRDYFMPFTKRS